ncbi:MAG: LysR family transcriptional regulator, partial [Gammaproteobacteria bacterium]|nr:LysR family transcriptional regulator [Gammaproteobacteria bacterium]
MHLEISELRAFRAVSENNGFSRAAEKIHLTQSAVSQAVSNLEKKLGCRLLERNPFKLTPAGVRLLLYAETLLTREQEVVTDIKNIRQGIQSTLQLALSGSINKLYGADLMNRYLKEFPLTNLRVHVRPSRQIIASVRSGQWELGFGPFQQSMPNEIECIPLFEDRRLLVLSNKHTDFETLATNTDRILKEVPLIVSHLEDPEFRPAIDRLRDSFGTIWQINDLHLRLQLVKNLQGMGYFDRKVLLTEDKENH